MIKVSKASNTRPCRFSLCNFTQSQHLGHSTPSGCSKNSTIPFTIRVRQAMRFKGKKVLILGSGGLRIGQAGEFDYSGSQAIKALKEEGIKTVLVNPNIATIQTDPQMADQVYLQPLNLEIVTSIIEKEKPDGILLGFGGQTALNLGLALEESGVLARHHITVLGTRVAAIRQTEDRDIFKQQLQSINIKTPHSICVTTVEDALSAA